MEAKEHFGNPLIEQRSLAEGKSVVYFGERKVIGVKGDDRISWLHSLLSQDIRNLPVGQSTEALLLDPNGHIEHVIELLDDGETSWLVTYKPEVLLAWLQKMVFRMKVNLFLRDYSMVGSVKQNPDLAHKSNSIPLIFDQSWGAVAKGGFRYSTRKVDYSWFIQLLDPENVESVLSSKQLSGTLAAEALRIAAGRPSEESEVDEKSLPHELDLLSSAVHLNKGCYRGQETVAKVHNLGHPPRRLTFLHLDGSGSTLPGPGWEIRVAGDDKPRGFVTSSAQHYEMGPIALALLQRNVDVAAPLEVITAGVNVAASQEVIVPADAGKMANVPKLPRLNLSRAQSQSREG